MAREEEENLDENLELDSIEDLEAEALKELESENNSEDNNRTEKNNDEDESEEQEEDNLENEEDNQEENNENEDKEDVEDTFKPVEFEIAGHKIVLNSEEELKAMLSKGVESISKQDNSLELESEIIKQGKLTAEDLKLLVDAKNGDAKAIAKLAANSNIDILEVDADDANNYVPTFAPSIISDVEKVAREISADTAHAEQFTAIASNLPQAFKSAIMSNANDLKTFSEHIKSGLAQQIIPEAMKLVYTKGIDFSDAYVKVGMELTSKQQEQKPKEERILTDREKELRKKASEQGNNKAGGGKKTLTVDDIANMSDEEFEKLTAKDLED